MSKIRKMQWNYIGPVHKGTNHIPKAVSDHNPLPNCVRDFTSIATAILNTNRSEHCEVNGPIHKGANKIPKELCVHKSSESGFLGVSQSKMPPVLHFKSLIWKSFAFSKGKIRLFKSGKGQNHDPKWLSERDSLLCEQPTGPECALSEIKKWLTAGLVHEGF